MEASSTLLPVAVRLGPLLGDLAPQVVERSALGGVEQVVFAPGRCTGALGHLVGLVGGHLTRADGVSNDVRWASAIENFGDISEQAPRA